MYFNGDIFEYSFLAVTGKECSKVALESQNMHITIHEYRLTDIPACLK